MRACRWNSRSNNRCLKPPNTHIIPPEKESSTSMATQIVAILGLPGAGKSTIKNHLFRIDQRYVNVVNTTTRSPRINNGVSEEHGKDYYFIEKSEFHRAVDEGKIVNSSLIAGHHYGTRVDEYSTAMTAGKVPVVDFDTAGYEQLTEIIDNVQGYFVVPRDARHWRAQFKARYPNQSEADTIWKTRLPFAIAEIRRARNIASLRYIVNNDARSAAQMIDQLASESNAINFRGDCESADGILSEIIETYGDPLDIDQKDK
ncbi:Guanylate kinase Gmk [Mycobacteroides abscessus subsp. abscessus]|nr:Guanylate kinase Gmk [Mycobacteroides abscessus subsp. abscessus]